MLMRRDSETVKKTDCLYLTLLSCGLSVLPSQDDETPPTHLINDRVEWDPALYQLQQHSV